MREEPEREPWPLCPLVEVLPMPEPIPRPMRFLFSFAFLGARRLERLRIAIVSSLNADEAADALQRLAYDLALAGVVQTSPTTIRRRGRDGEPLRPFHEWMGCLRVRRSG